VGSPLADEKFYLSAFAEMPTPSKWSARFAEPS